MPFFKTKKSKAALARAAKQRLIHQSESSLANQTADHHIIGHSTQEHHEMLAQEDYAIPPEVIVDIKEEEPSELETNPFVDGIHTEEIKVELVQYAEARMDPIGGGQQQQQYGPGGGSARCRFCLRLFRHEYRMKGSITKMVIEFVLGVQTGGSSDQEDPVCCIQCSNMFRMFYDFKKSCLAALTRFDAHLLIGVKEKNWNMVVSPSGSMSQEGMTGELRQQLQTEESTLCEISAPQQHWQTDFSTPANIVTPDLVPESSNDLDVSNISNVEMIEDGISKVNENNPSGQQFSNDIQSSSNEFDKPSTSESNSAIDQEQIEQLQNNQRKQCTRCWNFFETEFIYKHHKPFCIKARSKPQFMTCTMCPEQFKTERQLELHMNRHNGLRTIPCRRENCTKKFFTIKTRSEHESICGQTNQLVCFICAAVLKTTGTLRAHLANHGEPSFVCTQCNKAFHTNTKLKKHYAVHSDARNFECEVCGKRFKSHEAHRVHQRIHTQEKPYACHICGTAFTYNCSLKTHLEKGH
uniref:Putative ovo n=1 Tax=Aedes aegypti TaxID=7159 RepID=A0A0N8ES25_AEDAE